MTNQGLETGAQTPKRRLPLAAHIVLAQIAVLLCCLLVWYLCENVVPKEYSDATYRTELKMVDNNYNAMGYLKGENGRIAALQYNQVSNIIYKNPFYQTVVDEMNLLNEHDLTAGRLMDRVTWGYDETDETGRTITIDVSFADPAVAEEIGNRIAEKLNEILMDKSKFPGPPINQPNKIEHTGLIREPVRTGPNTMMWVIVTLLIAEGVFLTMAFQEGWKNKLNCVIMGFANASRGQVLRGLLFFLFEVVTIWYMAGWGVYWLKKLPTLGTVKTEHYALKAGGQEVVAYGDDSFKILLYGVLTIFFICAVIYTYYQCVKQGRLAARIEASGKKLKSGRDDLRSLVDDQFHKTLLALPVTGIIVFTVMPIIFMVLVAFTNYSGTFDGRENLFSWVGLNNFNQLLTWTSSGTGNKTFMATFGEILAWTLIWAFFATFTNYFLGMFVAMAINKKGIRLKKMWRTILVMTIAIPQFISLLYVSKMFDKNGIINSFLMNMKWIDKALPFWEDPTWARVTVILINIWIGIPYLMLITT
ncbi:MAG: sugar ABC transporter permease, partial [Erysipelotrichaceae bacterium]|nr:sugar ABC transporter permease [Erysipelotrichaceae bacterium]